MKNKTVIFGCDLQDVLLIQSLNTHETWYSFVSNSFKQIWEVERAALLWWARAALSLAYATRSNDDSAGLLTWAKAQYTWQKTMVNKTNHKNVTVCQNDL